MVRAPGAAACGWGTLVSRKRATSARGDRKLMLGTIPLGTCPKAIRRQRRFVSVKLFLPNIECWLAGAPETASEMSCHPGDDHLFNHAVRKDKIDVDLCQEKISRIVEIISFN